MSNNKEALGESEFLVCIRCMTYNQSAYISDAMNGFAMQQTNFPFLAVIVDDASTDGEQEVINSYIEEHFDHLEKTGFRKWETEDAFWIFAQHGENKNCHFVSVFLKRNLYCNPKKNEIIKEFFQAKFIAFCEGDDYWIDPLKLQKQVDFLEENEAYSMCFHSAVLLNECKAKVTSSFSLIKEGDYGPNDIFPIWVVPTASVVYRREKVDSYTLIHADWFVYGDIVLFEKCAHVGKLWGFEEKMSVYRMNENSLLQNVKYWDSRIQAMPFHFKALKMNFPLIDKEVLSQLIADSYYAKMRNDSRLLTKGIDFFRFVFANPRYSTKKMLGKLLK